MLPYCGDVAAVRKSYTSRQIDKKSYNEYFIFKFFCNVYVINTASK